MNVNLTFEVWLSAIGNALSLVKTLLFGKQSSLNLRVKISRSKTIYVAAIDSNMIRAVPDRHNFFRNHRLKSPVILISFILHSTVIDNVRL